MRQLSAFVCGVNSSTKKHVFLPHGVDVTPFSVEYFSGLGPREMTDDYRGKKD